MAPQTFDSFEEFFPYYVAQHSRAATRWTHFAGTHLGALSLLRGLVRRNAGDIARAPVLVYGLAWFSHFAIEHNRPATFGHPLWSVRGDMRMMGMMWQGRDAELDAMARHQIEMGAA